MLAEKDDNTWVGLGSRKIGTLNANANNSQANRKATITATGYRTVERRSFASWRFRRRNASCSMLSIMIPTCSTPRPKFAHSPDITRAERHGRETCRGFPGYSVRIPRPAGRSEEHTSELQSLM